MLRRARIHTDVANPSRGSHVVVFRNDIYRSVGDGYGKVAEIRDRYLMSVVVQ